MEKIRSLLSLSNSPSYESLKWKDEYLNELQELFEHHFGVDMVQIKTRNSNNQDLTKWFMKEVNKHTKVDWNEFPTTQLMVDYFEFAGNRIVHLTLFKIAYIPGYPFILLLSENDIYEDGQGSFIDSSETSKQLFEDLIYKEIERNYPLIMTLKK